MQQILSHGRLCYTHLHPKLEKTMDLKTGMGQNPVHCTPLYPWLVDIKIAGFSEWSYHVVIPCHSKNGGIDPSGACHLKREHQAWPPVLVRGRCESPVPVAWANRSMAGSSKMGCFMENPDIDNVRGLPSFTSQAGAGACEGGIAIAA